MSNNKLLTPSEVIHFAKMDKNFPPCDVEDIVQIEYYFAKHYLGKDLYKELLSDLADYFSTAKYTSGTTYYIGDTVIYRNLLYTAIKTTTNIPSVKTGWELAKKFNTDCFNELWCNGFLGRVLSVLIIKNTIPKLTVKLSAVGAVELSGEGYKSAKKDKVNQLIGWAEANYRMALDNMDDWINENNVDGCFNNYLNCSTTSKASDYSDYYYNHYIN